MSKRRTVNGIKLNVAVDEATRSKILRAGNKTEQMIKAAELGVLDEDHYKKIVNILKYVYRDFW